MAQQSNDKLARSLLDPSGREVLWPTVFAGVKNVVKSNNLTNDTLSCIKGWLKSNDSQLHIPLLGITVLHTISLNCSTTVRNQMASPKLFQRLEKQLSRPQGPQVATALVQLLVDWVYLFGDYSQEELGLRSQALLDQPRYRSMAAGCGPSPAVLAAQAEAQLGVPPVGPTRGEDFIRWMYWGASNTDRNPGVSAGSAGGGSGSGTAGFSGWPSVLSGGLPGAAPPPFTPHAVPELCERMRADAQRMTSALAACRTAGRLQLQNELSTAMDASYREAERCSQWRRRVQDYTQRCEDSGSLSAVLAATDVINQALQDWQNFTSKEVFDTLRIVVPPPPPAMRRAASGVTTTATTAATTTMRTTQSSGAPAAGSGLRPQGGGKTTDLTDLLGIANTVFGSFAQPPPPPPSLAAEHSMATATTARGISTNPFAAASASNGAANPNPTSGIELRRAVVNPFAEAHPPPSQPQPVQSRVSSVTPARVSMADWDPFAPLPPPTTTTMAMTPQSAAPAAAPTAAAAAATAMAAGRGVSWGSSAFPQDPAGLTWPPAVSYNNNSSQAAPSLASSSPFVVSPSCASVTSTASTPAPGGGGGGAATAAPSTGGSPRGPPGSGAAATSATSLPSYLQPFRDLLIESTSSSVAVVPGNRPNAVSRTSGPGGAAVPATAAAATAATTAAAGAELQQLFSAAAATDGSNGGSAAAAAGVLEWQPEFERLASELKSLWVSSASASPSSSLASHRAPSSSHASTSTFSEANKASNGGVNGDAMTLLPVVLRHVKGMCEALAAQHALKVAAAVAAAAAAPPQPHATLPDSASTAQGRGVTAGSGSSSELRRSSAAASSTAVGSPGATGGSGSGGAGAAVEGGFLGFGNGQAVGAGSWMSFGAGGGAPAVGPLQQHLLTQQHHRHHQHHHQHHNHHQRQEQQRQQ